MKLDSLVIASHNEPSLYIAIYVCAYADFKCRDWLNKFKLFEIIA